MKEVIDNRRGSLTAESTIGLFCFIFLSVFLMTYLGALYTESLVEESLLEASLHVRAELPLVLPVETGVLGENLIFQQLVKSKFREAMDKRINQRFQFIANHSLMAVDVEASNYRSQEEGMMKLSAAVSWPIVFYDQREIVVSRSLYCRRFSTFRDPYKFLKNVDVTHVYMADHPSVYHTNPSCRSIKNRHKTKVTIESLEGTFRECKFCKKERTNQ